ncbi:hypothetical protein [Amycolatopsis sp. NPDC003731]
MTSTETAAVAQALFQVTADGAVSVVAPSLDGPEAGAGWLGLVQPHLSFAETISLSSPVSALSYVVFPGGFAAVRYRTWGPHRLGVVETHALLGEEDTVTAEPALSTANWPDRPAGTPADLLALSLAWPLQALAGPELPPEPAGTTETIVIDLQRGQGTSPHNEYRVNVVVHRYEYGVEPQGAAVPAPPAPVPAVAVPVAPAVPSAPAPGPALRSALTFARWCTSNGPNTSVLRTSPSCRSTGERSPANCCASVRSPMSRASRTWRTQRRRPIAPGCTGRRC